MNDIEQALEHYRAMAAADTEYPVNDDLAKHRRTAIAALEKQVAKKMEPAKRLEADITIGRTIFRKGTSVLHKCPACGEYLPADPYCRFCGQRLKWDE